MILYGFPGKIQRSQRLVGEGQGQVLGLGLGYGLGQTQQTLVSLKVFISSSALALHFLNDDLLLLEAPPGSLSHSSNHNSLRREASLMRSRTQRLDVR